MLADLILNIAAPIAARRLRFMRKALWLVPVFFACAWLLAYVLK